jgi:phenylacetate-CoA ligase
VITHRQLASLLREEGLAIQDLGNPQSRFPILFVFGRADLTVPFYGAKVYPSDLEDIISAHPTLVKQINSYQLSSYEDDQINRHVKIHLEKARGLQEDLPAPEMLRDIFFDGLCAGNQDFREVTRMFASSASDPKALNFHLNNSSSENLQVGKVDPVPAQV